jgi:hypothetical protein
VVSAVPIGSSLRASPIGISELAFRLADRAIDRRVRHFH